MTKAQSLARKTLGKKFGISREEMFSLDLTFPKAKNNVLDIGFGDGEVILYLAKQNPESRFLGIEVHKPGIGSLINKASKLGLENIKIIEDDVEDFISNVKFTAFFNEVLLFFPDPWAKTKHKKRRLVQEQFIALLEKVIKKGGFFVSKTDCQDYENQISKLFSKRSGWKRSFISCLPDYLHDLPVTNFERKAIMDGRESSNIIFQKV